MPPVWTVSLLLSTAGDYLATRGTESARLDAELLLSHALGVERIDLYLQHDRPLTGDEVDRFREYVRRRARHEPVAYILGKAHFRYLTLRVSPAVLIPRPETEELVDRVLEWLAVHPPELWERSVVETPRFCDVGTGSGAIALSLATERQVRVLALDSSEAALEMASANVGAVGVTDLVSLSCGDLLTGVSAGSLMGVVSNPPYVSDEEWSGLPSDVRDFEPQEALRGGVDGLAVYRRLMPEAARVLRPGGGVFVEVGFTQSGYVADLAREVGLCRVRVHRDLSGKERMVSAAAPGAPRVSISDLTGSGEDHRPGLLEALRRTLSAGGILGVPTDTVYGLAAAWDCARGMQALREAKGRDEGKPFQVLFPSVDVVTESLPDLSSAAAHILEVLLPGPYTFVVATKVPQPTSLGSEGSLGIRVPDHPELLALLAALDVPLAATSANVSGESEARDPEEVPGEVAAACAALLEAQAAAPPRGSASTVVDLRPVDAGGTALVLREGAVAGDEVLERIRFLLS